MCIVRTFSLDHPRGVCFVSLATKLVTDPLMVSARTGFGLAHVIHRSISDPAEDARYFEFSSLSTHPHYDLETVEECDQTSKRPQKGHDGQTFLYPPSIPHGPMILSLDSLAVKERSPFYCSL